MAIETENTKKAAEEAGKGQGDNKAIKEEILSVPEQGVDVQAEDTIRYFIRDRLADFNAEIESAVDSFDAFLATQPEDFQIHFNQRGFFDFIGERFLAELMNIVGGPGLPLMDALVRETDNAIGFASHSEFEVTAFNHQAFRRGVRDACWYVRDACASLLSNEWGRLTSLAANGSEEFIPAVYQLGLPSRAFSPPLFADALKEHAETYRRALGLRREEVAEREPEQDAGKREEIEEQAQRDMMQEEQKKQATSV